MMIAAPTSSSKTVEDGGNFSADSQPLNSDDEQLDDTPFLSHQLPDDHESFSEKFLRNILTHDYQNLMPRRREKFVEITKTVTVTEIVNGAPDKHPSSCEVKVTNVSPAGPHPVNVSIKHLHEKWHSCEELDKSDDGGDLGKGTVIRIQETHKPFNYTQRRQQQKPNKFVYEDVVNTKMESSTRSRQPSSANSTLFNRSSDNIIDLEFRHPILVETSDKADQKQQQNGNNGTRRRFADLRKKVSTTTKTSVTETEKVTTTRRSSSAHSTSSRRSYAKPEVHTLYYRKFVDEETKGGDDDSSDSGSVIIHRDSVTRRSRSADHLQQTSSPTMSPIAPPRKRLGREESLHYYRDDEEVIGEQIEMEKKRRVTVRSPEPGNTSVSMNDAAEGRNITAGITSISMNDTCTDTSFESRFSTIPRARSSPPGNHRINHVHVNIIGPIRSPETERGHKVAGRVGEDVTMDIFIERRRSASNSRRGSHLSHGSVGTAEAPPKPPRRSKYEEHIRIGEPIATSTPMTTIERKQTREEKVSTESGQSSRKSTRSSRPPDINIIECETFLRETRSPARTPATPIVVINQTPSSRRSSQDLLGEPGQRRRKSTVTDIDWYAAFNMKDPSSPTKLPRPPFANHSEDRKSSRDVRRRASDSSMIGLPPANIDLNQIFSCTAPPEIKKDEKCQCNACRLIRMSEAERAIRIERASRSRQSRSFTRTTEYETRASTLPSRHRTSPVNIELEEIFNPKPSSSPYAYTKPPTPPSRRRHAPTSPTTKSSFVDESSPSHHLVTTTIDRKQVTPVTTNSRDSGSQLHENTRDQLLNSSDDWVGQMMNDANEWENRVSSRKSSVLSTTSSTARKVSVARRISIDELRKPEKRKSREAVPLPPSDHSIDDIFTALAPKKEELTKESERKTFIVTRKQRAQDVDIIDFEKDREKPVAPPRTKTTHTSEAKITMEDNSKPAEISTASINLEDVFAKGHTHEKQKTDEADEKIKRRVAEFTKAQKEKEMSRNEEVSSRSTRINADSNVSMDDVFNPPRVEVQIPLNEPEVTSTVSIQMRPSESRDENEGITNSSGVLHRSLDDELEKSEDRKAENRTSAVSIDLDKVFVEGSAGKSDLDASDEKIRRGIAEFKRANQEKEAQRTVVMTTHSNKHLFNESDISMDDVFNTSNTRQDSERKYLDERATATIGLSDTPNESTSFDLDKVSVSNVHQESSSVDDETRHIQKRIEEFKKAEEEQQTQRITESHSHHRIFDDSNISMDDVFNTSGSISPKQSEVMDKEEEHIRRRIEEFKRAEDEKQRTVVTESHSTRQIFDPSSISMDDVFNSPQSQEKSSVGIGHSGPTTVSTVNATETDKDTINLKSMFVPEDNQKHPGEEEELKHIQKRIEEFKEAEEQKHVHLVTNEDHPVLHSFDASKISLEDIFGAQKTPKIGDEKPSETSSASITMRPPKVEDNVAPPETDTKEDAENQTPAISINLESVFVTGTSRNIEKDNSDEKIRRDIVEFERSKQEKDIQRYGTADFSSSRRQILNESEISMDDVFSSEHKTAHGQKPVKSTSQISMSSQNPEISLPVNEARDDPLERTSNASIDLDKVFVEGSAGKSDVDASDERIRRGIAEFERSLQEKEAQRTGTTSTVSSARKVFSDSIISMEDVFNPEKKKSEVQVEEPVTPCASDETGNFNHPDYSLTSTKDSTTTTKTTTRTETETDRTSRRVYGFKPSPEEPKIVVSTGTVNLGVESLFEEHNEPVISTVGINLDDVFGEELKNRTNGDQDVREFNENIGFTSSVSSIRMRTSEEQKTVSSEVGKSEEDSVSVPRNDEKKNENRTSAVSIDLEKVFVEGSAGKSYFDASDEKIRRGIAEFERAKQEKEAQKAGVVMTTHSNMHLFDESDISMDDVFNTSKPKQDSITERKYPDEEATATIGLSETPKESTSFDLDKVSVSNVHQEYSSVDDEARHIEKRIKEFKKAEEEQQTQRITESHSHHRIFDDSNISMDDVFNTSGSISLKQSEVMDKEEEHIRRRIEEFKRAEEEKQRTVVTESHSTHHIFDPSSISMDDVFNKTTDSGCEKTTSDTEKTTTTTTTRTETTSESYSKKTVRTLDDLFGPQTATPPTISISAISLDQPSSSPIAPPRKHQNLSSLFVPGKWNESMMSNASTISLDDSFDNSFVKSGNSQVNEPKMRKPLTLPVDNWIDDLVSTVTDEATREAPKTPKSAIDNYYRSPTRISQEIKYEWVAKLIEDDGGKDHQEEIEEHQSEEEHLQKQDNTWVSSVVYRPTLETSAYTLRSSQAEPEQRAEIDMDRVFNNCLMGKKDDDEECECSACRLTEHELEEMKNRKIESENKTRQWRESASHDSEEHRNVIVTNPSQFSIETIFNPDVPLRVETHDAPAPSTSSPPLQSTRTYYISPKVSETVTTTHQWKDADISLDEIFSPVSSTTNENRRFSNFYEDRSGWDTIGSEDSGVMSGGDRGRRRSTRITDHVIDEAFKGIFDSQPSTSSAAPQPEQSDAQYDDYYITSLHQEDIRSSDSEVDPENLDVSQFVDDILGKSMDEAAFLSSTKSLRDHTDTSIDRKKSSEKMHSYYRTRTDTSMDRRVKPDVIKEDFETAETHSNDELLKLVFVDPSDPSISKSDSRKSLTLPRSRSFTKPSDEELLEIEIKPDYFVIKGSYSLLIPKSDPLGHMLQKLREQNNGLATLDFSLTRKLKKLLVNCIRERAGCLDMSSVSSKYEGLLSSRGQSLIESIDHASATFLKMNVDKYEPTRNPNGVVNFCTAENNICTPLLEERFKHLELFFPNTEHLVRYPPAGGWPEAREILVKYFKEFMGARVTVDELALTPSTRTGYDVTSYCLFEADDILLTNGPVYTGTISNVNEKAQCHVACVETDLANPRLDVKMYEAELNRQIEQENTVSGVIIVNPHNPLGVTFPPEEVVNLCNWAASKNLHVVIDEVFANCVFDKPNSKFRPFLSYRHRVHRPENVAWLWSVSKDFGLPGLKFAVIHSANEGLRQAATKLQMYYPCSPFVQDFAINLLSDSDWLREFHAEVNRRISIHYRYTAENLERLEIPFVPAQAGIFVFADFSKYLSTVDFAGELELFERLASAGVMLTPGVHQKCHVFGWFRIVFACTKEELEEGFRRLFVHLGSHLHPIGTVQYDN